MIQAIVRWAIRNRGTVVAATAALVLVTAITARGLKLDALPDVTANQVLVLTRAPGLTPEEVERRVTRPIEIALGGLPGLDHHRSLSRYGISSITVVFDDDVDVFIARQVVQERVNLAAGDLPAGVDAPELGPLTGGLGEIFQFTLSSPSRTPEELYELAEYRIAPILRAVPGVVEVNSWGGGRRTLDVIADPAKLANRNVTVRQLADALGQATGAVPGAGLPSTGGARTLLRGTALPTDAAALGSVVLDLGGDHGGDQHLIRLADLAQVHDGRLPRIGAATANGRGEAVYLMAQMLRDANALEVMDAIHERLAELRAVLPADVALDVVYDRSVLVKNTLRTVALNLSEGGLLVAVVLLLMLGSLRAGLLVAAAIPLSMLGAGAAMALTGIPGNLMSLGAIDFGLLVDGSVVMVERIFHALGMRDRKDQGDRVGIISEAAAGVARPMFFGVLVILLVYVPVVTLSGVDGKMFRPMALTVVFALATSLILALTFVPAASAMVIRNKHVPSRPPWIVRLMDRIYPPFLSWVCGHNRTTALGALALLVAGGWLFLSMGRAFIPQLDEGDLVVQTTRAPDIDLPEAVIAGGQLEKTVMNAAPEVMQAVSRIGSPAVATDIMGFEQADVFVGLKPRDQWRPGLTRDALLKKIQDDLTAVDRASEVVLTQPIQMRFNELLGGAPTDVTIAAYGEDLAALQTLGERIVAAIEPITGVADALVMSPPDVALAEVEPHPLNARAQGFSNADVLQIVEATGVGVEVGGTYDGPIPIPVRLRLGSPPGADQLSRHLVPTGTGAAVPLDRIAVINRRDTPSMVNHHNGQRRLLVGFNVRGADLGSVVQQARAAIAQQIQVPAGVRLKWGGQYEALESASRRMQVVIPVVIVSILILLLITFRRVRPALIILSHVPFACVGGLAMLFVRDLPISISAAVGFIALSGIAVLNGIVLLSQAQTEMDRGASAADAIRRAAVVRVRPVLMTALVAALGFVPMALATGVGAEVQRPLATVVVGGLVTSTLLTLVILPAVFPWFAGRRRVAE